MVFSLRYGFKRFGIAMIRSIYQVFAYTAAIVFVFFSIQLYTFIQRFSEDEKQAVEQVSHQLNLAEQKFNGKLADLMSVTQRLASELSSQPMDSTSLIERLEQTMMNNPDIFGFGVCYEPGVFQQRNRFGPFYIRPKGRLDLQFIEESYDYTQREWYTRPLKNGATWFEPPYYGEVAQTMMAEYSVPFFRTDKAGNKVPAGIVFLDYALDEITKAVASLDLGKSGYGFILSEQGTMIAHPRREYVMTRKNIDDFIDEWQDTRIQTLFDRLELEEKAYVQAINKKSGIDSRIFFKLIENSGWRLGAVFIEDAFKTDSDYINRVIITLTSCIVAMFMLMFLFYLFRYDFQVQAMKRIVPVIVLIFLSAIGFLWFSKIYQPYNIFQQQGSFPVAELNGLQKFLSDQDSMRSYLHEPELVTIPTGVFLKHVEFDGSHNVRLSGVIWQKYSLKADSLGIKPGLFFVATAPDAEAQEYVEIYRKQEKDGLLIGWDFRVEVREKMHYGLYPLDRERVSLQLLHPDFSKNIQLVPDLRAYEKIIPTELPGVDPEIILPEWESEQSYFAFERFNYNTNFGVLGATASDYRYYLGFNVILKRKFLWPTMANIIPLVTITILLFLALISTTQKKEESKGVLFSGFGLLELCAAFLFVAILTHIDLRSNLVINYIMYMDYFYFHVYFTIIICSLAAVLFNKEKHARKIRAVKLLYWPILLGSLFVFTAIRFY